jgi:hypothetical protein
MRQADMAASAGMGEAALDKDRLPKRCGRLLAQEAL